jgi:hypothetical protein
VRIVFALVSILLSCAVVHTMFTLRYAHLYYDGVDGGIDVNGEAPCYSDSAYLAFTIGDDLPGVGHCSADQRAPPRGVHARAAVIPVRYGRPRDHDQPRGEPGQFGRR